MSCDSFIASANASSCSWTSSRLVGLLRRPEQRVGIYAGDLLHQPLRDSASGERREVDLGERLLDQPLLVGVVERLAGHLLGREHGQVGDLLADLLERAPRLGLDVACARRRPAPRAWPCPRRSPRRPRSRTPCARGRRCRPPARAPPSAAGGTRPAARRPPRGSARTPSMFSRIALARFSSASPIRGKANFESTNMVTPKSEQRPDHQPERGRDAGSCRPPPPSPRPAGPSRMSASSSIERPRGRRRSGRR